MTSRPSEPAPLAQRLRTAPRVARTWLRTRQPDEHRLQAIAGLAVLAAVFAAELVLIVSVWHVDSYPLPLSAQQYLHFTFGR